MTTVGAAPAAFPCPYHSHSPHRHLHTSVAVPRRHPLAAKKTPRLRSALARAKFEKFEAAAEGLPPSPEGSSQLDMAVSQEPPPELDEDSDLPPDLEGAIRQSSQAAAAFTSSGGMRAIVELLIPQLQFLDAEGAQAELWELSRIFLESFIEESGSQKVKAVFPDAGAAALLKYQWQDAKFGFSSLSDRKPVDAEDEVVVMIVPDYQMLEYVERIANQLQTDPPRPLIMWNPRLVSEDVGVGFNVRKLRRMFLSTFTVVYSMRPLPSGAIFRCYPGMWKVFYDDANRPNRYLLAKELPRRPDAEDIEVIFGNLEEKPEKTISFVDKAMSVFNSLNRFMKAISR